MADLNEPEMSPNYQTVRVSFEDGGGLDTYMQTGRSCKNMIARIKTQRNATKRNDVIRVTRRYRGFYTGGTDCVFAKRTDSRRKC